MKRAILLGEGSSDGPLAEIVAELFHRRGCALRVTTPALDLLPQRLRTDVHSKVQAALQLTKSPIDLFIVHRDADRADSADRRAEIDDVFSRLQPPHRCLPVIPIQTTEAWLLLDEQQIREVAGNPRGRVPLQVPGIREAERRSDPKRVLAEALLQASEERGRRRDRVKRRFNEHRRQLLQRLDLDGLVTQLDAWQELLGDVDKVVAAFDQD